MSSSSVPWACSLWVVSNEEPGPGDCPLSSHASIGSDFPPCPCLFKSLCHMQDACATVWVSALFLWPLHHRRPGQLAAPSTHPSSPHLPSASTLLLAKRHVLPHWRKMPQKGKSLVLCNRHTMACLDVGRQIQVLVREERQSNVAGSWTTVRLRKLKPSAVYWARRTLVLGCPLRRGWARMGSTGHYEGQPEHPGCPESCAERHNWS